MILFLVLRYIDIDYQYYSKDRKILSKVKETSPNLRISSSCEIIQDYCFSNLKTLFSFTFQEKPNLTTIGSESFSGCTNLTIINLLSCSKLKQISNYAFAETFNVKQILLPEGLLEIGRGAFQLNYHVTSIIIPASIKILGENAFLDLYHLRNVIFEEGSNLTSLEHELFTGTNIYSFQIPEKVSRVNGFSFSNQRSINLTIHPNNNYLTTDGKAIYSKNGSILFFIYNKTGYEIPNSVITIGNSCFYQSLIKTITIPTDVKRIEDKVFYNCRYLKNVTFLGRIDFIGYSVFCNA